MTLPRFLTHAHALMRLLIAVSAWFVMPVVVAAESEIRFHQLSRQEGLSQSFVLSIAQDREGYMWFGTQGGLNRFDGYEVKSFIRGDSEDSLPDNVIRTLLTDSAGRLWIGTDNGGVSLFDANTETFKTYNTENSALTTDRVRVLHQGRNNQIWVGTDGAGLWGLTSDTISFSPVSAGSTLSIRGIADKATGGLWIATESGLLQYDNHLGLSTAFADKPFSVEIDGQHVRSVLQEPDGMLWVGTETKGVYRVSPNGQFVRFHMDGAPGQRISGPDVSRVFQDDRGEIWLATTGGLDHFTGSGFVSFRNDPTNPFSLSNDMTFDIFQDQGGVMWVATFGGVSYWSRSEYIAQHVIASQRLENTLSSPTITAFTEAADKTLWVGTYGGGLNEITPDGLVRHYKAAASDVNALPEDNVMSLLVDSRDRLWVGTRSSGLVLFDKSRGVVKVLNGSNEAPHRLSSNAITSITESRYNELLVGTYGGGLNRIDMDTLAVTSEQAGPAPGDLQSNRVMAVHEDRNGHIWLGTDGAGLAYFDRYREEFVHFSRDEVSGMKADFVMAIAESSLGTLYFGTLGAGLFRLETDGKAVDEFHFKQMTREDGLVSNNVYGLVVDDTNYVWLSSNGGLSRVDSDGSTYHLGLANGLQDLEFTSGAALVLQNGELVFGGINGFNRIEPWRVELNPHAPPVVITSIAKQGQQVVPTTAVDAGVELTHQDYVLEISFAGLDFANAAANQYRYRLLGLDDAWIDAGTRRYVSYTNLQPGQYEFEVTAANSDGVWSDEPARIPVTVLPAPWLSSWAYGLYAGLILLLGFLMIRAYRIRRTYVAEIQLMNDRLQREVEARIAKEVEISAEREKTQRHLDVAEVALIALDVEGFVLQVNDKAEKTFTSDDKPLVGSNLLEYVDIRQRNTVRQKILSVFDGEDDGRHVECQVTGDAAEPRTMIWRFAPLSESGGHASMILASGTDITELRTLERSVRFKEKLSSLGTLSAGIAHDFNNILTAITGYSNLALERVRGQGDVEMFVKNIEQASNRAAELVARILSVTQIDEEHFNPSNINNVLKETIGLLKGSFASTISIESNIPDRNILVNGDPTQLQQMIMNLGTNAAQAMKGMNGELTFRLSPIKLARDEVPTGSNLEPGDYVLLEVIDTGRGMPESTKQKIFDPFYSSDGHGLGERSGTGLGLSIVHGIVLAHRGHIEVESELGRGTRFCIYLPVIESSASSTVVQLRAPTTRTRRIMLVDDEEWVVDVTSRLLSALGHEVESFTDPYEALERFKADPDSFELVVTDQNMPQMKGTELIQGLRRVKARTPVLIMSGNISPIKSEDEITTFMGKPFKLQDIKDAFEKLGLSDEADRSRNPNS